VATRTGIRAENAQFEHTLRIEWIRPSPVLLQIGHAIAVGVVLGKRVVNCETGRMAKILEHPGVRNAIAIAIRIRGRLNGRNETVETGA